MIIAQVTSCQLVNIHSHPRDQTTTVKSITQKTTQDSSVSVPREVSRPSRSAERAARAGHWVDSLRNSDGANPKSPRLDVELVILELAAGVRNLQPNRVPRFKIACRHTLSWLPARLPSIVRGQIGRGVEPQSGDHCPNVTVLGINREPTSAAAFAVTKKITRWQR